MTSCSEKKLKDLSFSQYKIFLWKTSKGAENSKKCVLHLRRKTFRIEKPSIQDEIENL